MSPRRTILLPMLLLLLAWSPSQPRAQSPNGTLRGEVQDATDARVIGARVVLQTVGSSISREATSKDRGEFRLDDLLPGPYRITVSATGSRRHR